MHDVSVIWGHGHRLVNGVVRTFYRVSWAHYSDQDVIDSEGVGGLEVDEANIQPGPLLQAYLDQGLEPTEGGHLLSLTPGGTTAPTRSDDGRHSHESDEPDPIHAFILGEDQHSGLPLTSCTWCRGLFTDGDTGHDVTDCPGSAPTADQLLQVRMAQAAYTVLGAARATAPLESRTATARSGGDSVVSYPFQSLHADEAHKVRDAVRHLLPGLGSPAPRAVPPPAPTPRQHAGDNMAAAVQRQLDEMQRHLSDIARTVQASRATTMQDVRDLLRERDAGILPGLESVSARHVAAPAYDFVETGGHAGLRQEVADLQAALAREREAHRIALTQLTERTNAAAGVHRDTRLAGETTREHGGVLAGFEATSGMSRMDFVLRKLRLGGEHLLERRIMVAVAALLHEYQTNCLPTGGVGGARIARGCRT